MTPKNSLSLSAAVLILSGFPYPVKAQAVQITITSEPVGRDFTVTGAGCYPRAYRSPQIFIWPRTSACQVTWTSPAAAGVTSFLFDRWADGQGANPRTFQNIPANTTFTAVFNQASFVSLGAQCRNAQSQAVSCPSSPGSLYFRGLLPGTDVMFFPGAHDTDKQMTGLFPVGSTATVGLKPNAGFSFLGWIAGTPPRELGRLQETPVTIPGSPMAITAVFRIN